MKNEKKITSFEIIEKYKQGYSCKDICNAYNISALIVRNCLRSAGYNTRNYRKVSENNREKILLLVNAGYSYTQIEDLLQVSTHLIREVVYESGMTGMISNYHHPIQLNIKESEISFKVIDELRKLYYLGEYGLSNCAAKINVSDNEFLWFVFHLTNEDKQKHNKQLRKNIKKMYHDNVPVTAISKKMDISLSLVKKMII